MLSQRVGTDMDGAAGVAGSHLLASVAGDGVLIIDILSIVFALPIAACLVFGIRMCFQCPDCNADAEEIDAESCNFECEVFFTTGISPQ